MYVRRAPAKTTGRRGLLPSCGPGAALETPRDEGRG